MYNKDIILYITSFLNVKDVLNLKLVCKKYKDIINGKDVWNLLLKRDFKQFVKLAKDAKQMYKEIFLYKKNLLLDWRIEKDMEVWDKIYHDEDKVDDLFEDYTLDKAKIVHKKILKYPEKYEVSIYFDVYKATNDERILIYGLDNFEMEDIFDNLMYSHKTIFYDEFKIIISEYLEKFIDRNIDSFTYKEMIKIFYFLDEKSKWFKVFQNKISEGNKSKDNLIILREFWFKLHWYRGEDFLKKLSITKLFE